MTLVVDLNDLLDKHGDIPTDDLRLRRRAVRIATLVEYGGPLEQLEGRGTMVTCRRRPRGKQCLGFMWVVKRADDRIQAHCSSCGDVMLACSFQNAQLRVFDIRDPHHAKEIAYWKAGAVRTKVLPASGSWAPGVDRTVDKIAHWVRWVNGNGHGHGKGKGNRTDLELWTVSDGHGFQVLRFTDHFKEHHRDLDDDSDD
jgi:hypothetical protein